MSKRTAIIVAIIIIVLAFIGLLIAVIVTLSSSSSPSSPSSPVVPVTQKYACDAHGNCVVSSTGTYPDSTCGGNKCTPHTLLYSCIGTMCTSGSVGTTDPNCDNKCTSPERWACVSGQCVNNPSGTYINQADCSAECKPGLPHYKCTGGTCTENNTGRYTDSDCNNQCSTAQTLYSCIDNACTPCGTGSTYSVCNTLCSSSKVKPNSSMYYTLNCGQSACTPDINGGLTYAACLSAIKYPVIPPNYECVNNMCVANPCGQYTDYSCSVGGVNKCNTTGDQTYRYLNETCVNDPFNQGPFTSMTECKNYALSSSTPTTYSYYYNTCVSDPNGQFETKDDCETSKSIGSTYPVPNAPYSTQWLPLCISANANSGNPYNDVPACVGHGGPDFSIPSGTWGGINYSIGGSTLWTEFPSFESPAQVIGWHNYIANLVNSNTVGINITKVLLRVENPMSKNSNISMPWLPANATPEFPYGICVALQECVMKITKPGVVVYILPVIGHLVQYPPYPLLGQTAPTFPVSYTNPKFPTPFIPTIVYETDGTIDPTSIDAFSSCAPHINPMNYAYDTPNPTYMFPDSTTANGHKFTDTSCPTCSGCVSGVYEVTTYAGVDVSIFFTDNSTYPDYTWDTGIPNTVEKWIHLMAWYNLILGQYNLTASNKCPMVTGFAFDYEGSGMNPPDVGSDCHFYAEKYGQPMAMGVSGTTSLATFVGFYGQGYLTADQPMRGNENKSGVYRIDEFYPEYYNLTGTVLGNNTEVVDWQGGTQPYKGLCDSPAAVNSMYSGGSAILCFGDTDCDAQGYVGATCNHCYLAISDPHSGPDPGIVTPTPQYCGNSMYLSAKGLFTNGTDQSETFAPFMPTDSVITDIGTIAENIMSPAFYEIGLVTGAANMINTNTKLSMEQVQDALNRVVALFTVENMYKATCKYPTGYQYGCMQCGQVNGFGAYTPNEFIASVQYFFANQQTYNTYLKDNNLWIGGTNATWGIFQSNLIPTCWI